ncbi:hypothetical protein D0T53_02855 [Dysgonomonas sp. 216]|uniref:hypothetical protein n=1 Tax=Dysgonomonas sp. 216 TaxID=2302934 RepID=UPI0013D89C8A|nr:hypothetical protein [Dysgonomonas sp. 216]NDW17856.1 hypothetical protein [Dysgonomonas sp. 216]
MTKTFKERVSEFWKAFEKEEAEVRSLIDNKAEANTMVNFVNSILNIAFEDPFFEMGVNDEGKYELILTPEGDRARLLELHYWHQMAPESLSEKWNFYSTKPGHPNSNFGIQMYDISLSKDDVVIYYEIDEERPKINLQVYSPKLMELDEDQRFNMFFIFLDQFIGELYTMEYIGYIDFTDEELNGNVVSLSDFKNLIVKIADEKEWPKYENPYDVYSSYKMKPTEKKEWSLREDVMIGYTACIPMLNAFFNGDNDFFNKFKADGVDFGFIYYENINVPQKEMVPFRSEIEDKIMAIAEERHIANSLGGATGFHFSYIDFIIFDKDAFIDVVKNVLSEYNLEETGFCSFAPEDAPVWFNN